jgi:hypothetical protein
LPDVIVKLSRDSPPLIFPRGDCLLLRLCALALCLTSTLCLARKHELDLREFTRNALPTPKLATRYSRKSASDTPVA